MLLTSACLAKEAAENQMSIEDVIAESLQLDNIQSPPVTLENDVSSRSLKNELSKAFSKIVASTPLKNDNLPPNEAEIDNAKLEEASKKSGEASQQSNEETSQGSEQQSPKDEASESKSRVSLDAGLEASTVSGENASVKVDEASGKTSTSVLDELENQSESIDNLETVPVDTDEEELDEEKEKKSKRRAN